MIPVFTARRRAEAFDALVEDSSTGARADARTAEFLEIVNALREVPPVAARPEFVTDLREQLMAAADTVLVPAEGARLVLPAPSRGRDRRLAAAVGGLALVGATTSVAMAAQGALPGDALYPVKRAIENAEAGLTVDDGEKGATLLANAADRLTEISELSREGRLDDTAAIAETLDTFSEQSTEAADLLLTDYATTGAEGSVSELRDFTGESMGRLADLDAVIPADADDELLHAAQVLTRIDAEAARACPSCAGVGITEIPAILASAGLRASVPQTVEPATTLEPVRATKPDRTSPAQPPASEQEPAPTTAPGSPAEPLPAGSVVGPPAPGDSSGTPDQGDTDAPVSNPLGELTGGLAGTGGSDPAPEPSPVPGVEEQVQGVEEQVPGVEEIEDVVEGLTDPLLGSDLP